MVANKVPPHITVADFNCADLSNVINSLEVCKDKIKRDFVYFASIGLFNPSVLFLAPVVNEFLVKSCERVNILINETTMINNNRNYLPCQWVPHSTIAAKLSSEELETAFSVTHNNFKAFGGYVTKLALVQNEPRHDIRVWNL